MRQTIARRLLIALFSLWVAVSLVFLILVVAPGDIISQRLANLENQGSTNLPIEIVGSTIARETTIQAPFDSTLRSIADEQDLPLNQLLKHNPERSADEQLPPGARIVTLPGERLSDIAIIERIALPENAERGVELLLELNPNAPIRDPDGDPWVPAGTEITLRESVSVAEFARTYRITAVDLLEANPDGGLTAETLLYPGDQITIPYAAVTEANIRHRLGFDRSLIRQYGDFLWGALRFDYGTSFQTQQNVLSVVASALPRTVQLNLYALILAMIIALLLGLIIARRPADRTISALQGGAALGYALPSFWLAIFLIGIVVADGFFFDDGLWTIPLIDRDAYSITQSPSGFFALYSIPAVAAALPLAAAVFAAAAPGEERDWRAAAQRLLSALRIQLPLLISLNFVLELAVGIPGLGMALLQNMNQADMPAIAAITCITVLFMIFAYFAIDTARAWLDRASPDREAQA